MICPHCTQAIPPGGGCLCRTPAPEAPDTAIRVAWGAVAAALADAEMVLDAENGETVDGEVLDPVDALEALVRPLRVLGVIRGR